MVPHGGRAPPFALPPERGGNSATFAHPRREPASTAGPGPSKTECLRLPEAKTPPQHSRHPGAKRFLCRFKTTQGEQTPNRFPWASPFLSQNGGRFRRSSSLKLET